MEIVLIKSNYIIITIIFLIIGFSGCVSGTEHYDGQFFSFDYPNTWEIWEPPINDDESIIYLKPKEEIEKSGLSIEIVYDAPVTFNHTLQEYQQEIIDLHREVYIDDYSEDMVLDNNFKVLINRYITVNDLRGFDLAVQHSEYMMVGDEPVISEYVVLQRGVNNFTEIRLKISSKVLESSPNIFERSHEDLMVIVNSLNIKS